MNCNEIIREAAGGLGITRPNSTQGSSDIQIVQLLALLNQEGTALSRRFGWQSLIREITFTTVAAASQGAIATIVSAVLASYQMSRILNDTITNRSQRRIICGPQTPRRRQAGLAISTADPFGQYSIRGGLLLFDPIPSANETCAFEIVLKTWATNVDGSTYKVRMTADDDIPLLDDDLLLAGLKWRWKKEKGLEYGEDFQTYEALVADAMAADGTKARLSLDSCGFRPGIFVPNGSWNL